MGNGVLVGKQAPDFTSGAVLANGEIVDEFNETLIVANRPINYINSEKISKIEKDYGNTPWGKRMFDDLFRWL